MQKLIIDKEFKNLIPPLSEDEFNGLEADIIANGCRVAIDTWDGVILDGHNRYEICTRIDSPFKTNNIKIQSRDDAKLWIINNQFNRRNLSPGARIKLMLEAEPIIARMAKERQREAGKRYGKGKVVANVPQAKDKNAGKTRTQLAKKANVGSRTFDKGKAVLISKTIPTEIKEKYLVGEISTSEAYKHVNRSKKEAKRETKRKENAKKIKEAGTSISDLQGVFQTILIDPPWSWEDEKDHDQLGRSRPDYATMSIDEIANIQIPKWADKDCHLYLWITNRSLPKGFGLIEKWEFRYVTMLTWPKPSFGMGNYFRGQTEHILFGVRGSLPLKRKDASTLLDTWPRGPKGHSSKPVEIYEFIESCSPGPYLEVFSRMDGERKDWSKVGE